MRKTKRAYDLWDFPSGEQTKSPPIPSAPQPKIRKKPGPKPRVKLPLISPQQAISQRPDNQGPIIKKLVDEIRKFFVKLDIRDPKPRIPAPESPPVGYISNIILDGQRIGFFEQPIDGDRVYLRFEKGQNIPVWHEGDDPSIIASKIENEIEKHYTKKLAAKLGYRVAIKIAAHRRGLK